jgi:hypothetical protein
MVIAAVMRIPCGPWREGGGEGSLMDWREGGDSE